MRQKGFATLIILLLVIIVGTLGFIVYTNTRIQKNITDVVTKTPGRINELISYVAPSGWKEFVYNDPYGEDSLQFTSPDYSADQVPQIKSGASIDVDIFVSNQIPEITEGSKAIETKTSIINGNSWTNHFFCWEGCRDEYYLKTNEELIRVTFQCTPDCDTKSKANSNTYSTVRDAFLQSIKTK